MLSYNWFFLTFHATDIMLESYNSCSTIGNRSNGLRLMQDQKESPREITGWRILYLHNKIERPCKATRNKQKRPLHPVLLSIITSDMDWCTLQALHLRSFV